MKHTLSVMVLAACVAGGICAARTGDTAVDAVNAGDEQSERVHGLQGDEMDTVQANGQTFRIAGTNGWFSWNLKTLPDVPQELRVDFGGGGRRGPTNKVEITVDGSWVATLQLSGAARREYYALKTNAGAGRNITVKFKALRDSAVGGVSSVSVEKVPPPSIASASKASSTRTNYQYIVQAINDQHDPTSSGDRLKRHFDWWPIKGTNTWVQYDFAKPARVSAVEVYWFDDTGRGECRLPKSWRLFYRQNGEWKPVTSPSGYGCEGDRYNRTTFDAVETDGLRLDAQLPEKFSSGLLQWRVE